ncbi:MAG: hypothetical protein HLUCCO16_16465 [Phormidium sp. OSCR]|nr:MAG: hypothetical protein HLUCCO16_16465 [Phormidium sp. OSCR]
MFKKAPRAEVKLEGWGGEREVGVRGLDRNDEKPNYPLMNELNRLRDTLRSHLSWHGARLNFVCLFLMALFQAKTVNLAELATVFANPVQISSNYKRLQRFLGKFDFDLTEIARFVVSLIDIPQPWTLSLDRTCWSLGQTHFNILMLAVVHEGIAFPLLWTMLDKKGNSRRTHGLVRPL